jgi:hypothetical protein
MTPQLLLTQQQQQQQQRMLLLLLLVQGRSMALCLHQTGSNGTDGVGTVSLQLTSFW